MTHFLDTLPFDWTTRGARDLHELLASVYYEPAPVKIMAARSGIAMAQVNWYQTMDAVWYDLITAARGQGLLRKLLAQIEAGPDRAVAQRVGELLAARPVVAAPEPAQPPGTWKNFTAPDDLERQIFRTNTFQDVAFLRRGTQLATAVCRLRVTGADGEQFHGTGFRIGPDLLLTSRHVLYGDSGREPAAVEAWFRYETDLAGRDLEHLTVPCDPAPVAGDADDDWAVVRTTAPMPADAEVVALPAELSVAVGDWVYIIQHPHGGVKKLAARHNVVRAVDERVVQYWTDTESGSSGSPVFDERWRLVALHRRWTRIGALSEPREFRNEGVRIDRIAHGVTLAGLV